MKFLVSVSKILHRKARVDSCAVNMQSLCLKSDICTVTSNDKLTYSCHLEPCSSQYFCTVRQTGQNYILLKEYSVITWSIMDGKCVQSHYFERINKTFKHEV